MDVYRCVKCGNTYPTREQAHLCENSPISPFKYEIGDTVISGFQSHITNKKITLNGKVEERWIQGLSKKGESPHRNMYKLRVVSSEKGLIAIRYEEQIIGKA
ncbi:MAG: hypothetical protein WED05_09490 [Candidatus Atabeyarchaeum deiterrae]